MRVRDKRDYPAGSIVRIEHRSRVLLDNIWGDPELRELAVYLPHDYQESGEPFVALWDLAAYTNSGLGHLNWRNQGENLIERLDRLVAEKRFPSPVVVIPDCYTSLGGNQYVNSPSVGRYADYLVEELVPFVADRFNVVDGRDGRGLFGKSSGGYGALYHAIHYPETWGAVASHAADAGFDLVYRPEFPTVCRVLEGVGGDIEAFIRSFWRKNRPNGGDYSTMMILAMAASYDADPDALDKVRLPFDLRTCELIPERWQQWLSFDPVNMVKTGSQALKSLHGLYIDVGIHDQYNILYGSRRLVDQCDRLGIDYRYEEFDGTHSAIDWRLDYSIPFLVDALKNAVRGAI
jgi:enterochelin esterase-like enzyme